MRLRRYLDTILLRSALLAFCMTINCFTHFFFFLTTFPHTPSPISAIATRIFFSKLCPQFMDCQRPRIFRLSTKGVYILKKKKTLSEAVCRSEAFLAFSFRRNYKLCSLPGNHLRFSYTSFLLSLWPGCYSLILTIITSLLRPPTDAQSLLVSTTELP